MQLTALDNKILCLLGIMISSVYLLVYAPYPESIDGAETLDVAATWVQHGIPAATRLTTPRQLIVASADTSAEVYTLSPDGERYSKKGVTPSLALIPFVIVAHISPWFSTNAAAMLLNPVVTTATGLLLYSFARRLGTSYRVAITLTLVFSFATFSIVYVKTLFGEPLAGLLLLIALYQAYCYQLDRQRWHVFIAGSVMGLAMGVNLTYALLILPIGLYMLWSHRNLLDGIFYGVPIAITVLLLGGWNWLRFGSPLETGYYLNNVEGFSTPFREGMTGLWLSFYKGFFWFNPVLIMSAAGIAIGYKKQPVLTLTGLSVILLQSMSYASWWAWDGAWCWGPRFLLPIVPIMVLFLIPVIESGRQHRGLRVCFGLLMAISILLQIPGILFAYIPFYETSYQGTLFHWQDNIAFAAYAGLFPLKLEPALFSEGFDVWHGLAVAMLMLVGIVAALRLTGRMRIIVVCSAILVVCGAVVARQQSKPSYQFVRDWEQVINTPGTAFVPSFEFDARLLDIDNGVRIIVTNPHAPQDLPVIQQQWAHAQTLSDVFYLVTWFPPASPDNWFEADLWRNHAFVRQDILNEHRVLRFDLGDTPEATEHAGWYFDNIVLNRYGLKLVPDGLYVTLEWEASATIESNYSWFVHLLDETGAIMQQQDREPQGRYNPTSSWQPGTPVIDRLFFPLPEESDVANWQLRIGVVNPRDGQPIAVLSQDGSVQETSYVVMPITTP